MASRSSVRRVGRRPDAARSPTPPDLRRRVRAHPRNVRPRRGPRQHRAHRTISFIAHATRSVSCMTHSNAVACLRSGDEVVSWPSVLSINRIAARTSASSTIVARRSAASPFAVHATRRGERFSCRECGRREARSIRASGGAQQAGRQASALVAYRGADLLRVLAAVDVLGCPRCSGRMRIIATVTDPEAVRRILACIGLPTRGPPLAPPRERAASRTHASS